MYLGILCAFLLIQDRFGVLQTLTMTDPELIKNKSFLEVQMMKKLITAIDIHNQWIIHVL